MLPLNILSSGSLRLDIALGIGGFPKGSMIELCGSVSSGKTLICQHIAAEAQRQGGLCAWIDADNSFSINYAVQTGMRLDKTIYCAPSNTEMALGVIESLTASGLFTLIVLDSLQGLVPQSEFAGKSENPSGVDNEELLADSLYRLVKYADATGTIIIFTNKLETSMSAVYHQLSQHPHRFALKLRTGIQIRLIRKFINQDSFLSEQPAYQVKIIKNKYFHSLNVTDFDIIYPQGINKSAEIFEIGIALRRIIKQNDGYYYQNHCLGTTLEDALSFLALHESISDELEKVIRRILIPQTISAATRS